MSGAGRVLVAGASGYIGRAVVRELVIRGYRVVALLRGPDPDSVTRACLAGAELRVCRPTEPGSFAAAGFRGERFDAVISCIASRSGMPVDACRVDRDTNIALLEQARRHADHMLLLSAICVQKPLLAFQRAKLAAEAALISSGMRYTIVRPTAFFKSLAGQVARVQRGKAFLVFGNGTLSACKPISERDLANFIADSLSDPSHGNCILPVGGPGPAITPREQGELLFAALGRQARFQRVPVAMFDYAIRGMDAAARLLPRCADRAEFARIGRYYATESMLVRDPGTGRYDAAATPEYGSDTLGEFYQRVVRQGLTGQELGAQALFERR